jgi:hypothetical protein
MTMRLMLAVGLVLGFAALPAAAQMVEMSATLSPGSEVPAVQSPGSGTAAVTFNTQSRELSWVVQFQGLTAPFTASHFHGPATVAQNGGVVVPIAKAGDASPFKGSATLTSDQAADLLSGRWYVNVHTATYPPGELRGQVVKK